MQDGSGADAAGSPVRSGGALVGWLSAGFLFCLAAAIRAVPFPRVFFRGDVHFAGSDAYYHMRRVLYAHTNFPAHLEFDPYINFPDGARAIWTPTLDWGIAALMRLLPGEATAAELEARVVWVPPVLGALTVVALFAIARRHFGTGVALVAGLILSVLYGHVHYSQVGFLDHHSAVALTTLLLLGAAMELLDRATDSAGPRTLALPAAAVGGAIGLCLLVWPGSLFHVGLVEIGLLVWLLTRPEREAAVAAALAIGIAHAVAFLLVAPLGLGSSWAQWSAFSPVVLSSFQPWFTGSAAVFGLACALAWQGRWVGRSATRRSLAALAILSGLLLMSTVAWPALPAGALEAWEWFSKTDEFQSLVAESMPLFRPRGEPSTRLALRQLSAFVFLVPFALIALGAVAWRSGRRAPLLLLLLFALGLSVATVNQTRFMNSASIYLALLLALCARWLYGTLAKQLDLRGSGALALGIAIGAVLLALLWPTAASYRPHLRLLESHRRLGPGSHITLAGRMLRQAADAELANWLRANTPPAGGWLDARARPDYGVVASWSLGHLIEYRGQRPTSNDGFGDDVGAQNFLAVRSYFGSGDETRAASILDRLQSRYVVAQRAWAFLGSEPDSGAMLRRLYERDGLGFVEGVLHPALSRHRLVFESRITSGRPEPRAVYKVFEYVAGARLLGSAPPHSEVRAVAALRTNTGRVISYETHVRSDAAGRYALRVPYANVGGPPAVQVASHYSLSAAGSTTRVRVRETEVREGLEVAVPPL